jgi:chitinase
MKSVDPDGMADASDKPDCMPLGAISFRLKVPQPGDTVQVTVYLSEPAPSDARWYKHTPAHGWGVYSNAAFTDDDRRMVDLVLKDGDPECGDADGVENGYIVDPSGIGITDAAGEGQGGDSVVPGGSSSGGGGGCYISTAMSGFLPPLPWLWLLFVAALVVGLGVNFSRRV